MRQTFHPAVFLGGVILLCTAWLWARPPVPAVETFARAAAAARARRARVDHARRGDARALRRQVRRPGGFTVELTLKNGRLLRQAPGTVPFEMLATSETEFFLKERPGVRRQFASETASCKVSPRTPSTASSK